MASFPTTQPPDIAEINAYIRFFLGNIDTDVISDPDMNDLIQPNIDTYIDNLCKITYYSTVDVLNWLIRAQEASLGDSEGSGAVTRRKEKRGKTEIEVEFDDQGNTTSGWEAILDDLLKNPTKIGCNPFSDVEPEDEIRAPIIGGADVNGYEESFRTRNRFGCAIKENRYGYGRSRFGRRSF